MTPTCVGNGSVPQRAATTARDNPHVCGEGTFRLGVPMAEPAIRVDYARQANGLSDHVDCLEVLAEFVEFDGDGQVLIHERAGHDLLQVVLVPDLPYRPPPV